MQLSMKEKIKVEFLIVKTKTLIKDGNNTLQKCVLKNIYNYTPCSC